MELGSSIRDSQDCSRRRDHMDMETCNDIYGPVEADEEEARMAEVRRCTEPFSDC